MQDGREPEEPRGGRWVRVASTGELAKGAMKPVAAEGLSLALYRLDDGSWHASDNSCTHAFALLTDGWLEGCFIEWLLATSGGRPYFELASDEIDHRLQVA